MEQEVEGYGNNVNRISRIVNSQPQKNSEMVVGYVNLTMSFRSQTVKCRGQKIPTDERNA